MLLFGRAGSSLRGDPIAAAGRTAQAGAAAVVCVAIEQQLHQLGFTGNSCKERAQVSSWHTNSFMQGLCRVGNAAEAATGVCRAAAAACNACCLLLPVQCPGATLGRVKDGIDKSAVQTTGIQHSRSVPAPGDSWLNH